MRTDTPREERLSLFFSSSPWHQGCRESRQWAELLSAALECQAQASTMPYLKKILQINATTKLDILTYLIILN